MNPFKLGRKILPVIFERIHERDYKVAIFIIRYKSVAKNRSFS